jgi:hypothetical protein
MHENSDFARWNYSQATLNQERNGGKDRISVILLYLPRELI